MLIDKFPFHQFYLLSQMCHQPNVRGYNDDSISYCFKQEFKLFLSKQTNWKVGKVKMYDKEACK